jgi:hypothetical protein
MAAPGRRNKGFFRQDQGFQVRQDKGFSKQDKGFWKQYKIWHHLSSCTTPNTEDGRIRE